MSTTAEPQTPTRNERRAHLRELSKLAKIRMGMDCEGMTVNEVLIQMYTDKHNTQFKTLQQWNREGFNVIKGSTSFLVWGSPQELKKKDAPVASETEDEKDDFYPLCYLFSNAQVHPRN